MKTKLLPSREERWDELKDSGHGKVLHWIRYDQFHNFLKQAPELYMFVPCDDEGNVLEKPERITKDGILTSAKYHSKKVEQYQQALDRVIFDGFEIFGTENFYRLELSNGFTIVYDKRIGKFLKYKTLADLSGKVYLNINGIKQVGIR